MLISICFIVFTLNFSWAYKILLVFPFPTKSHAILGDGYVRNLLKAGHEVTYITPYPMKNIPEGLRIIDVSQNIHSLFVGALFDLEKVLKREIDFQDISYGMLLSNTIANVTLWNPNVRKLLMDPHEQFDVVVAEWLNSELYCGFAAVFNCPYIWSSSMEPHALVLTLIDEMPNPAYNPAYFMAVAEPPYSFSQRVKSLWDIVYMTYVKRFVHQDYEIKMFEDAYGPAVAARGRHLPSFSEVKYNASLMLGNSHISTGFPVRLPQNYIPIAGYHLEDVKPLPEDIKRVMDNAHHGVIYFSMGTVLKISTMPEVLKKKFLEVFGGLKQTVIWKSEEDFPGAPNNVHILKWAPQTSILEHPNCVLFITHGGLLSTTEAVKSGVPIIGIPLFADQFINIDRAIKKGFGKKIEFSYDTPRDLKAAIEEMISDKRYQQKVKELSFVFHHRLVSPGAELVHWIEHVVKTRGAPHLRSPARHFPAYQKYYLDLVVLIAVVILLLKYIFKKLLLKKTDFNKKNM